MGKITRTNFGLTKTVTLNNAQILTLPTHAVTIVPAITASILVPMMTWMRFVWTANIAGIDPTAFIALGHDAITRWGGSITEDNGDVSNLLASGASANAYFSPPLFPVDVTNTFGYSMPDADVRARALTLFASNALDFTMGDPANTLTVTVFYNVIPAVS